MELTLKQAEEMMRKNGGNLDLSHSQVKSIPEGLIVKGSLDLSRTAITKLPKGLTVIGDLNLMHTQITSLPEDIIVGGSLDLSYTPITTLPKDLIIGGSFYLYGSFYYRGTRITSLPEGFTVGGNIELSYTSISRWSDDLAVGGTVYAPQIDSSQYRKLKDGDYVPGKYLYANGRLIHVKSCHKVGGYTMYVGKIKGKNVVSDGKNYVWCKNFEDGIKKLLL